MRKFSYARGEKALQFADLIRQAVVIPVLVIDDEKTAAPLAQALVAGGLPLLEVTLRTSAAWRVIDAMQTVDGAIIGVGTVTRPEQFQQAKDIGAQFVVTPGADPLLLEAANKYALPALPGVMTPSEAMTARNFGFNILKFFPAEAAGGAALLKALYGPFPDLEFCPTGGINADNFKNYLALPNVCCVGGSWLAPPGMIAANDWSGITALARQAVA